MSPSPTTTDPTGDELRRRLESACSALDALAVTMVDAAPPEHREFVSTWLSTVGDAPIIRLAGSLHASRARGEGNVVSLEARRLRRTRRQGPGGGGAS